MWLDRLSGHSTPSTSSTPRNRSSSPAPRRSVHLTAPSSLGQSRRPAFSPRSSSLSLASHTSSVSLADNPRQAHGSAGKQNAVDPLPATASDPLEVLESILGSSLEPRKRNNEGGDEAKPSKDGSMAATLASKVEFEGSSLHQFAAAVDVERAQAIRDSVPMLNCQSVEECMGPSDFPLSAHFT
jgi:hypothetical protein